MLEKGLQPPALSSRFRGSAVPRLGQEHLRQMVNNIYNERESPGPVGSGVQGCYGDMGPSNGQYKNGKQNETETQTTQEFGFWIFRA